MLFLCLKSNAIDEQFGGGSRIKSMAGIGVSIPDNWSSHYNQAGLAYLTDYAISAFYSNRFNLKETGYSAITIVLPVKPGTFSINASNFGYSAYSESKIAIGFGKRLGKYFSAGIQVNYIHTFISDIYDDKNGVYADLGLISIPFKKLRIGFHVINPIGSTFFDKDLISPVVRTGISYDVNESILIGFQIDKELYSSLEIKAGMEFELREHFFIRSGINLKTIEYSFGIGIDLKNVKCDLGFSNHQILGYSPNISLTYEF